MASFIAFQHRKVSGGLTLTILMFVSAWWSLGGLFETSSIIPSDKFFWSSIEYVGGVNVPVIFLIFTLQYTHPVTKLKFSWILSLFIIPAITILAAFTNDSHNLIWTSYLSGPSGTNQILYQHGIWFFIGFMGYSYVMLVVSMIILINAFIHYHDIFRYQLMAMVIAAFLPWIGNIFYLLNVNPLPGLDLTRIAFSGSGLILVFAVTKLRFLELLPKARALLLETMSDGILVVDASKRIVDINPAARSILGFDKDLEIIGKKTDELPSDHVKLINVAIQNNAGDKIYTFPPKYIEINLTSLYNNSSFAVS